ncbi:Mu transposase C-terminal domain-containing protein [Stutzerimonas nitrititolerans]|uniref:Mu transposase C-terminal domain-containing protein n=1 Tax=Stutzerimonas nitrititolerans TaxID=2482751 RepID=UPI0028B24BD2|nr:Mu transposase C-terminal domain-containing protein [Stutzerimonas nitrititolerans]
MRKWFTAQELAGLPGMPGTERAIQIRAKRDGWEGQRRLGSKAIEYSFDVLPTEAQAALVARLVQQEQPAEAPQPTAPHTLISPQRDGLSTSRLNDDQRDVMAARVAIIREIERMSQMVSQQRAILTLVGLARDGQLSPYLQARAFRANDRPNSDRILSERTIKRWLADFRKHGEIALAPARRKPDMSVPTWAPVFLKHYQRPQKPSCEAAYALFKAEYPGAPSIHAVRRFLGKLAPQVREQGRMGPRERKSLQAHKDMNADVLWPNDVWVADGHKFDAEVINPDTGQIFRPEVTTIIDWGTRRIVGFAVDLAESTWGTLDALRDALTRVGMYAVFYVDNGKGFKNEIVREVNDRLGGIITHSLPYSSQARGVIERSHRTILVRLAKTYDSYIGADMDKEASTRVHRLSRKELDLGLKPKQVPEFAQFVSDLRRALDEYNHRPHRGLPKIRDIETGRLRHQSPMESWKSAMAEGWEPIMADADVVATIVRPQEVRTTNRAKVQLHGHVYFLQALEPYHGQEVRVGYDVHDASRVWVHTLDGELIGEAELNGNTVDAKPKSLVEKAKEKRIKGQVNKLGKKAKTLTGEDFELRLVPKDAQAAELSVEQLESALQYAATLTLEHQTAAFVVPDNDMARYDLWQELEARCQRGEALSEDEAAWHANYPNHPDFKSIQRMYDFHEAEQARVGTA